jgi:hypothetical protein
MLLFPLENNPLYVTPKLETECSSSASMSRAANQECECAFRRSVMAGMLSSLRSRRKAESFGSLFLTTPTHVAGLLLRVN